MERNGRIRILGWIPNDDVQFVHLSRARTLSNDLLLPTIIIYMYSTVPRSSAHICIRQLKSCRSLTHAFIKCNTIIGSEKQTRVGWVNGLNIKALDNDTCTCIHICRRGWFNVRGGVDHHHQTRHEVTVDSDRQCSTSARGIRSEQAGPNLGIRAY